MRELQQIVKDFIIEAKQDNIGLWRIINAVQHETDEVDQIRLRVTSLILVEELLNHGLEVVDYYQGRGWARWPEGDHQSILARIEREWIALGREPNLGDICWFGFKRNDVR